MKRKRWCVEFDRTCIRISTEMETVGSMVVPWVALLLQSLCDGCKLRLCFCMCRQEVWLLICSDTTVTVRACSVVLSFWGDSWLRAGQTCRMVDSHWNFFFFSLLYQISKLKALWRHSTCWFLVAYSTSGRAVLRISDILRLLFLHRSNHEVALFWSFPLPFALHLCLEVSNWTQDLCLQRAEIWLCKSIKRETDALSQTGNTHLIMYFILYFFPAAVMNEFLAELELVLYLWLDLWPFFCVPMCLSRSWLVVISASCSTWWIQTVKPLKSCCLCSTGKHSLETLATI